jgi:hypothetical protein
VNEVISDLKAAPKTGKLISEFFEITYDELLDKEDSWSQEWVIKNLTDELQFAMFSGENTTDPLDFWIMQNETFGLIEEIQIILRENNLPSSFSLADLSLIISEQGYSTDESSEVLESIKDLQDIPQASLIYQGLMM